TSPVGTGSVTVNGTNTSHGTFGGSGQVIGAVATNQFAHLAPGGVGAVDVANPLTLNSGLTLANGSTVDAEFNGFGNDVVNANALTLSGVSAGDHSVTLNLADLGAGFHNGTFALINYSSLSGGDLSNFGLTLPVGANPSNFTLGNTGSAITVAITGYASTIT